MKAFLRAIVPGFLWKKLSRPKRTLVRAVLRALLRGEDRIASYFNARELNELGLNVSKVSDYYSPLPIVSTLEKNRERWFKPSALIGVQWEMDEMKAILEDLVSEYAEEWATLPSYEETRAKAFGEGFTPLDAFILYCYIRKLKPKNYLEVGAGISTYYCSLAASQNAEAGHPLCVTCIDPYPAEMLCTIRGIEIQKKEVQDVGLPAFETLQAGDVLFIDSTHVVKTDGDVPYLFLEVLPRLGRGVFVHIHDIPFPYNVPYPPDTWIFGRDWPCFWTEAMLLQALLCNSVAYKLRLSLPMLRYFDEDYLRAKIPGYDRFAKSHQDTFSSVWIEKVQ